MSLNITSIIKHREGLLFPESSGGNKVLLHFPSCCFSFLESKFSQNKAIFLFLNCQINFSNVYRKLRERNAD